MSPIHSLVNESPTAFNSHEISSAGHPHSAPRKEEFASVRQHAELLSRPCRMAILTEGHTSPQFAKTAANLIRYRSSDVVAIIDSQVAGSSTRSLLNVPVDVPIVASLPDDVDTLVIGVAIQSSQMPQVFRKHLRSAIERGIHIVSGMHEFLSDDPEYFHLAMETGSRLIDVRKNNERDVATRTGLRDGCLRVHTVGHDCGCGKMIASVEIDRELRRRQHDSKFVATGQTGIMISGEGLPIDCVVADFIAGAAEKLVLANQEHDILLVEGQGSLAHPRYSGVTLGLLHGCAPQALILCYEAGRPHVKGMPHVPLWPLARLIQTYEGISELVQPAKVIGIAMNSRLLTDFEAERERHKVSEELGLPVCDVIRNGAGPLADVILRYQSSLRAG